METLQPIISQNLVAGFGRLYATKSAVVEAFQTANGQDHSTHLGFTTDNNILNFRTAVWNCGSLKAIKAVCAEWDYTL